MFILGSKVSILTLLILKFFHFNFKYFRTFSFLIGMRLVELVSGFSFIPNHLPKATHLLLWLLLSDVLLIIVLINEKKS